MSTENETPPEVTVENIEVTPPPTPDYSARLDAIEQTNKKILDSLEDLRVIALANQKDESDDETVEIPADTKPPEVEDVPPAETSSDETEEESEEMSKEKQEKRKKAPTPKKSTKRSWV